MNNKIAGYANFVWFACTSSSAEKYNIAEYHQVYTNMAILRFTLMPRWQGHYDLYL